MCVDARTCAGACMCACVGACVCVCVYVCGCVCVRAHVCVRMFVHVHVPTCVFSLHRFLIPLLNIVAGVGQGQ